MLDLLLEDVTVVRPEGRFVASIGVADGKIVELGTVRGPARLHIGGQEKVVIPGLVDTHVHFRDPGHVLKEDWASGSAAAISGGVTTVCDMPNTSPPTTSVALWHEKNKLAQARSCADYGIWVGATRGNVSEINDLMGGGFACGIKVFMGATTGTLLVDDATLVEVFEKTWGLIGVHAEDEGVLGSCKQAFIEERAPDHSQVRPAEAALVAVRRLLELVRATGREVQVCHVSTALELGLLEDNLDLPVRLEVCPHHLWLSSDMPLGNWMKCNPPVRPVGDQEALWEALGRGRLFSLGSDHAPHTREEKQRGYWEAPSGIPGVETLLPLMLRGVVEGRLSLERLVGMGCEQPSRLFGLSGKGRIEVGYDADLVVLPDLGMVSLSEGDVLSRVGWSPFVGMMLVKKPQLVFRRGELVASEGQVRVEGGGRRVRLDKGSALPG